MGIAIDGCISEEESDGRKGHYPHMGVAMKRDVKEIAQSNKIEEIVTQSDQEDQSVTDSPRMQATDPRPLNRKEHSAHVLIEKADKPAVFAKPSMPSTSHPSTTAETASQPARSNVTSTLSRAAAASMAPTSFHSRPYTDTPISRATYSYDAYYRDDQAPFNDKYYPLIQGTESNPTYPTSSYIPHAFQAPGPYKGLEIDGSRSDPKGDEIRREMRTSEELIRHKYTQQLQLEEMHRQLKLQEMQRQELLQHENELKRQRQNNN